MKSKTLTIFCFLLITFPVIYSQDNIHKQLIDLISTQPTKQQFKLWHYIFDRPYDINSTLGLEKYRTFKENLNLIKKTNEENLGFKLGLGPFTDLSFKEFLSIYSRPIDLVNEGSLIDTTISKKSFDQLVDEDEELEANSLNQDTYINWNYLWPEGARAQENCGGCWAFAAIGALEAKVRITKKDLSLLLSVQQLLECNRTLTNRGCDGGNVWFAMKYLKDPNIGVSLDKDYPYDGMNPLNPCKSSVPSYVQVVEYEKCDKFSPLCTNAILNNFLKIAPYASSLKLDSRFQHHQSGVYSFDTTINCKFTDHAVLVTHYDPNKNIISIKNSWGRKWGENGFALINTSVQSACGLLDSAYVVTKENYSS
jgi:hypothetical protein